MNKHPINLGKSGKLSVDVLCTFNHRGQKWFCHESHDRQGEITCSHYDSGYRALRIPRYLVGSYRGEMIGYSKAKLDAIPQETFNFAMVKAAEEEINT